MWPVVNLITGTVRKDHPHSAKNPNWKDIALTGFVVSVRSVRLVAKRVIFEHCHHVNGAEIRITLNVSIIKLSISAYSNLADHG